MLIMTFNLYAQKLWLSVISNKKYSNYLYINQSPLAGRKETGV